MSLKLFTVGILLFFCLTLPAENLFRGDASAEAETDSLTTGTFSGVGIVPKAWDDKEAFHGKKSVRVDWDARNRIQYSEKYTPSGARWMNHFIGFDTPDIKQGEKYTVSFYAKASKDDYPLTLIAYPNAGWIYFDGNSGQYSKKVKLSKEWKRFTLTFIPHFKANALKQGYSIMLSFADSPVGSVWFDAVQVERGDTATAFTPVSDMTVGVKMNSSDWTNIYLKGEPVKAAIHIAGKGRAVLKYRTLDYLGGTVSEAQENIDGEKTLYQEIPSARLGWFKIVAELMKDGEKVSEHSTNYVVINPPVKIAQGIEPFCGIIDHDGMDNYERLVKLGVKRNQVRAPWKTAGLSGLEPEPGVYDFSRFEWSLKKGREYGMKNKVIMSPFSVPNWYFDKKELEKAQKDGGAKYLVPDSSNHAAWTKLIGMIMKRYGNMIDEFELGAEDNGHLGHSGYYMALYPEGIKPDARGVGWLVGGKVFDDLCDMVKSGAAEIRKHDPKMKIGAIRPSEGREGDDWFFVKEMFRKIGKDFNVFPCDPYLAMPYNYGPDVKSHQGTLDGRFHTAKLAKEFGEKYGCGQPYYISECGIAVDVRYPDESPWRAFQAEMTAKDFVTSRAAGFYAYDYFQGIGAVGGGVEPYSFYMVQNQKIQSVAAAYSAAAQVVENVVETKWITPDRVARIAVFRKNDGNAVAAVWADKGYSMPLPGKFSVTDMMGNTIHPGKDGAFSLSSAPIYIWGTNYAELCSSMEKAHPEHAEFCTIMFRMKDRNTGSLKLLNNSRSRDMVLNVKITDGTQTYIRRIPVPRDSYGICSFPVSGSDIKTAVSCEGRKNVMTREFKVPAFIPIRQGDTPASPIGSVESRSDIYPPSDPWVPWSGPSDLSAKIFASWTREKLLLKIEVTDDFHFNKFNESTYRGDSIQIGIDPENNGTFHLSSAARPLAPDDIEFGIALGNDGKLYRSSSFGSTEICADGEFTIRRNEEKKTTVYEIAIPWKKLKVVPVSGMLFGMSLVIFDDDSDMGQTYFAPVGEGVAGSKNPGFYRKFILE